MEDRYKINLKGNKVYGDQMRFRVLVKNNKRSVSPFVILWVELCCSDKDKISVIVLKDFTNDDITILPRSMTFLFYVICIRT